MPFICSICGEESTRICARCTKDACDNHLCEKCLRCSDCCECEVTLSEPVRTVVHVPAPEPAPSGSDPLGRDSELGADQAVAEPEPPSSEPVSEPVAEPPAPELDPDSGEPLRRDPEGHDHLVEPLLTPPSDTQP